MTPPAGVRRRGTALERAIFDAVLGALGTVGSAGLTMGGVAVAARTGKAALYRRWPGKDALVADALRSVLPSPAEVPPQDSVRDDLLALLRCQVAGYDATHGAAFQAVKAGETALLHSVIRDRVTEPVRQLILAALQRGAQPGEVRPDAATRQVAAVGPAMIMY